MSTKYLLVGGDGFQLYEDLFEEDCIYLQFSPARFQASEHFVCVRIPNEAWDVIRHHGGPNLSLLDKSDEEVIAMVGKAVDERMRAHEQGELLAILGDYIFGNVEASRDDQIAAGISAYENEIRRQRQLSETIDREKRRATSRSARLGGCEPFDRRGGAVADEPV